MVGFDRQVEIEESIAKGEDGTRSSAGLSRAKKRVEVGVDDDYE